jgi:hypothetical protein
MRLIKNLLAIFFKGTFAKISDSIGEHTETSSVRLQSYLVLIPIILMVIVFLMIEIWAFIHAAYIGADYVLSSEIIVVFGMVLSHHLALLFSRSKDGAIEKNEKTEHTNDGFYEEK